MRKNILLELREGIIAGITPLAGGQRPVGEEVDDLSHCTLVPALVDCSLYLGRSPSIGNQAGASVSDHRAPPFAAISPAYAGQYAALVARHIQYCLAHGVLGGADNDDLSALFLGGAATDVGNGSAHAAGKAASGKMFPDAANKTAMPTQLRGPALSQLLALLRGHLPGGGMELRLPIPYCAGGHKASRGGSPHSHDTFQNRANLPPLHNFFRLFYSNSPNIIENSSLTSPAISQTQLRRLLQHKGVAKAVVVANGRQQVAEALDAGCDAIEQGYDMGEDNLRKMAEMNVLWIPSLLRAKNALDGACGGGDVCCRFSQRYVAPGKPNPEAEAFWRETLTRQLAQLAMARELGVKTVVGTGAGSVGILHGESVSEEIKLFIKAGYSLEESIRCASTNGAEFFGMERLGPLTIGRPATFLITRGTAQQLPRKLSYLEDIYINGTPG